MPSKPIALSDSEMDAVYSACRPLAPNRRDSFLQALAAELRGKAIGPGSVHRAIAIVQRQYFDPPLEADSEGRERRERMSRGKWA